MYRVSNDFPAIDFADNIPSPDTLWIFTAQSAGWLWSLMEASMPTLFNWRTTDRERSD